MGRKRVRWITVLVIVSVFVLIGCGNSQEDKDGEKDKEYVLEVKNGKRFFKSEAVPKSKAEEVILDSFKIEINDEYDNLKNVFIDSEHYNYYSDLYKENLEEGLYTEEIIIHSLIELKEEEYSSDSKNNKYYFYMDKLREYNPNEFKIIEVEYTNKLTDKLNEMAQWGSGKWTRYFVVVKEKIDSEWKIYDIYGHM
ncbi:MAG: DUF4829 domain-containing protein [Clostridium sp.]